MRGWAHHVLFSGAAGDVEFALGETRYDSGERIGTFLAVAQLDADGPDGALHGRPLARDRVSNPACASMPEQTDFVAVADGLIAGTADDAAS